MSCSAQRRNIFGGRSVLRSLFVLVCTWTVMTSNTATARNTVYNFEVATAHIYWGSRAKIFSHNHSQRPLRERISDLTARIKTDVHEPSVFRECLGVYAEVGQQLARRVSELPPIRVQPAVLQTAKLLDGSFALRMGSTAQFVFRRHLLESFVRALPQNTLHRYVEMEVFDDPEVLAAVSNRSSDHLDDEELKIREYYEAAGENTARPHGQSLDTGTIDREIREELAVLNAQFPTSLAHISSARQYAFLSGFYSVPTNVGTSAEPATVKKNRRSLEERREKRRQGRPKHSGVDKAHRLLWDKLSNPDMVKLPSSPAGLKNLIDSDPALMPQMSAGTFKKYLENWGWNDAQSVVHRWRTNPVGLFAARLHFQSRGRSVVSHVILGNPADTISRMERRFSDARRALNVPEEEYPPAFRLDFFRSMFEAMPPSYLQRLVNERFLGRNRPIADAVLAAQRSRGRATPAGNVLLEELRNPALTNLRLSPRELWGLIVSHQILTPTTNAYRLFSQDLEAWGWNHLKKTRKKRNPRDLAAGLIEFAQSWRTNPVALLAARLYLQAQGRTAGFGVRAAYASEKMSHIRQALSSAMRTLHIASDDELLVFRLDFFRGALESMPDVHWEDFIEANLISTADDAPESVHGKESLKERVARLLENRIYLRADGTPFMSRLHRALNSELATAERISAATLRNLLIRWEFRSSPAPNPIRSERAKKLHRRRKESGESKWRVAVIPVQRGERGYANYRRAVRREAIRKILERRPELRTDIGQLVSIARAHPDLMAIGDHTLDPDRVREIIERLRLESTLP